MRFWVVFFVTSSLLHTAASAGSSADSNGTCKDRVTSKKTALPVVRSDLPIQVSTSSSREDQRCPFCRDGLGEEVCIHCPKCKTQYHVGCFFENNSMCITDGCNNTTSQNDRIEVRPRTKPKTPQAKLILDKVKLTEGPGTSNEHENGYVRTLLAPDGTTAIVERYNYGVLPPKPTRRVSLIDLGTQQEKWSTELPSWENIVRLVTFSPDGNQVVLNCDKLESPLILSMQTGEISRFETPTGNLVATSVGKTEKGDLVEPVKLSGSTPTASAFSSDGSLFFTGNNLGQIQVWDFNTRQLFAVFRAHPNQSSEISIEAIKPFFNGGKLYLLTHSKENLRIWDLEGNLLFEKSKQPFKLSQFNTAVVLEDDTLLLGGPEWTWFSKNKHHLFRWNWKKNSNASKIIEEDTGEYDTVNFIPLSLDQKDFYVFKETLSGGARVHVVNSTSGVYHSFAIQGKVWSARLLYDGQEVSKLLLASDNLIHTFDLKSLNWKTTDTLQQRTSTIFSKIRGFFRIRK